METHLGTFFWETSNFANFSDLKQKKLQVNRNWPASLSSYLRCLPWNKWRKNTFCWKHCSSNFSLGFWVVFLALLAGKFGRFIRTVCLRVRCTLRRLYFKNCWFFENFWIWTETLRVFGSRHSTVLSENQITWSEEKTKEISLRKLTILFWFWAYKTFSSLAKIDQQRCQNCIRCVQGNKLREWKFCRKKCNDIVFPDNEFFFAGGFAKGLKFPSRLSKLQ